MSNENYRMFNAMRSEIKKLVKAQIYCLPDGERMFESRKHLINQVVEDEARKLAYQNSGYTCKSEVILPVAVKIAELLKSQALGNKMGIAILGDYQ